MYDDDVDEDERSERAAVSVSVAWRLIRVPDGLRLRRLGELDAEAGLAAGGSTMSLADSTPCRARASLLRMAGIVLLMVLRACFARSSLDVFMMMGEWASSHCKGG